MIKAGLLPRLGKNVLPVYVEATPEDTEARLQKGLRKVCPDLPAEWSLIDILTALRRGRVIRPGQKVLLVIDQLEQWLFARRDEQNTELVAALRQCDGEHVQAIVMARDDFWMAATRFMRDLEIRLVEGENSAAVDLFQLLHASKVLTAFGRAYGVLPEKTSELTAEQRAFVEQSVAGLAQEGKVISVRLALFAEMVKGKPWTPETLRDVGGTQGVGVTFLEETFSASTAPPEHRLHQKAAQAVLKALLPQSGTDIKGQMRPESELRELSGYASRPRDFDDLIGILDGELRLITPTDPEGSSGDAHAASAAGQRYYQLTHDYLVHSLRDWLTRKQRETRRGRAELILSERAAIWSAKPEIRQLPTLLEWASIRTHTNRKSWTDPERRMMQRAGWFSGLRVVAFAGVVAVLAYVGLTVSDRDAASTLVANLRSAPTDRVPALLGEIANHRRWADPQLKKIMAESEPQAKDKLHASLALLPVDPTQVEYLASRVQTATPDQVVVLRDALKPHRSEVVESLWSRFETLGPKNRSALPLAAVLAGLDPGSERWEKVDRNVADAMVGLDPASLGSWIGPLRLLKHRLTGPLERIFQDSTRPELEHSLATSILVDYDADDPESLAELIMDADAKAYVRLFDAVALLKEKTAPVFQAELKKKPVSDWNDAPIDAAWGTLGPEIKDAISAADGGLKPRFAFCQTMSLGGFESINDSLKKSGYRLVRFRPFADGKAVKVAAIWNRDGLNALVKWDQTAAMLRGHDETYQKDGFVPTDVAGYVSLDDQGKPVDRFAAVWAKLPGAAKVRLYSGLRADELAELEEKLNDDLVIPRSSQVMLGCEGRELHSGVWGPAPSSVVTALGETGLCEADFAATRAQRRSFVLIDASVNQARSPIDKPEDPKAALESANEKLAKNKDDAEARKARAMALLRLGEPAKAEKDLSGVVAGAPDDVDALYWQAIAWARVRDKEKAGAVLSEYSQMYLPAHAKLGLAVVVAAELDDGLPGAIAALEHELSGQLEFSGVRYEAARAYALASNAVSRRDSKESRRLAARAIELLNGAVDKSDLPFSHLALDPALESIRHEAGFTEVLKAGKPDRRYSGVWTSDGRFLDQVIDSCTPAEQVKRALALVEAEFRPVSFSVARPGPGGPLAAVSVWHRPTASEEKKDALAARAARGRVSRSFVSAMLKKCGASSRTAMIRDCAAS